MHNCSTFIHRGFCRKTSGLLQIPVKKEDKWKNNGPGNLLEIIILLRSGKTRRIE